MGIKDLPSGERPREKLIKRGAKNLTNSELLAIILRTGNKKEDVLEVSRRFFRKYNIKSLSKVNFQILKKELGIGDAKACQILACFELGKRLFSFNENEKPLIKNANDVAKLFLPKMSFLDKEYFKVIFLDSKRKMINESTIFIGSLNESIVHPREIFKIALEENSAAIILLHNHPSGDVTPSKQDIKTTKEITKAGELMKIEVLDHIIVGGNNFISLREMGEMD